jgi:hypothetical protein
MLYGQIKSMNCCYTTSGGLQSLILYPIYRVSLVFMVLKYFSIWYWCLECNLHYVMMLVCRFTINIWHANVQESRLEREKIKIAVAQYNITLLQKVRIARWKLSDGGMNCISWNVFSTGGGLSQIMVFRLKWLNLNLLNCNYNGRFYKKIVVTP